MAISGLTALDVVRAESMRDEGGVSVLAGSDEAASTAEVERGVAVWLEAAAGFSPDKLRRRLDQALVRLWRGASVTLDEATLAAVVGGAAAAAAGKAHLLSRCTIDSQGLRCEKVFADVHSVSEGDMHAAARVLLVELVNAVGPRGRPLLADSLREALRPDQRLGVTGESSSSQGAGRPTASPAGRGRDRPA